MPIEKIEFESLVQKEVSVIVEVYKSIADKGIVLTSPELQKQVDKWQSTDPEMYKKAKYVLGDLVK